MKYLFILLFTIGSMLSINAQKNLNLMPWPQEVKSSNSSFQIEEGFSIQVIGNPDERIYSAANNFLRLLSSRTGIFINQGFVNKATHFDNPSLLIEIDRPGEVKLGADESYSLITTSKNIKIKAKTDLGAMYGLNTLLQSLTIDNSAYVFQGISINDFPRFPWRGIMIDVSRHFMPVNVIKRNLDAMAYVKMNVFHWHLSDDQGFRFESKKLPQLQEKGSDNLYYTQEQIKEVIEYATDRGIRVVPEIDVPGHASAILTAFPELGSKDEIYQIDRRAGIFDPTLDPTNEKTYVILDILFGEMAEIFPDEYFHIGGDENAGKHWDENKDIQNFMKEKGFKSNHDLQTYMNIKLEKILNRYGKKVMGWDEIMTADMPKSALIHSWRGVNEGMAKGGTLIEAAKKGYKTVLSNGFYLDLMQPVSEHYLTELHVGDSMTESELSNILGGEATMWSELVTELNIDSRIWPRAAAVAERFWSDKEVRDVAFMQKRLDDISYQLESVGVTHLRNKDVILRNVSNNQSIEGLNTLVNISEPFKIYTRNAKGTEYLSYSPFTLFVDACNVDAPDALVFNKAVNQYINNQDLKSKNTILAYFEKWNEMDLELQKIALKAPIVNATVLPYSKRISDISSILQKGLVTGNLSSQDYNQVVELLNKKEDPKLNLDVELAITESLLSLANYLK